MFKAVIKVGKLYYAGESKGVANFTHDIDAAVRFDMDNRAHSTRILADELGGEVVPLIPVGYAVSVKTANEWLSDNLGFILNCVGDTRTLLSEFMAYYDGKGLRCDVSDRLRLPCRLELVGFEADDYSARDGKGNPRYSFCFRLSATVDLTPEQQAQWDTLPYGIPLVESRRLLVDTLDGIERSVADQVVPSLRGNAKVADYPEREQARQLWEERQQTKVSSTSKVRKTGPRGMRRMNLG